MKHHAWQGHVNNDQAHCAKCGQPSGAAVHSVPQAVLKRWLDAPRDKAEETNAEVKAAMVLVGMCKPDDDMDFQPHSDEGMFCIAHNLTTTDVDSFYIKARRILK